MATESDLIRRYRGAFTKEQCKNIISHINYFEEHSLMFMIKISTQYRPYHCKCST